MQKRSHGRRSAPNDTHVAQPRHQCRATAAVMQMARDKFGPQASLQIALRSDSEDQQNAQRNAQRWLAGQNMSVDNFADLLRSDIGSAVVDVIMGPDPALWPQWYGDYRKQLGIARLHRELKDSRRKLDALMAEGT